MFLDIHFAISPINRLRKLDNELEYFIKRKTPTKIKELRNAISKVKIVVDGL